MLFPHTHQMTASRTKGLVSLVSRVPLKVLTTDCLHQLAKRFVKSHVLLFKMLGELLFIMFVISWYFIQNGLFLVVFRFCKAFFFDFHQVYVTTLYCMSVYAYAHLCTSTCVH